MDLNRALAIANQNVNFGMASSAVVCLFNAQDCIERGDYDYAWRQVLKSLRYSVGVFHKDYIFVKELHELECSDFEA